MYKWLRPEQRIWPRSGLGEAAAGRPSAESVGWGEGRALQTGSFLEGSSRDISLSTLKWQAVQRCPLLCPTPLEGPGASSVLKNIAVVNEQMRRVPWGHLKTKEKPFVV